MSVNHFTKYGVIEDDDSSAEDENQSEDNGEHMNDIREEQNEDDEDDEEEQLKFIEENQNKPEKAQEMIPIKEKDEHSSLKTSKNVSLKEQEEKVVKQFIKEEPKVLPFPEKILESVQKLDEYMEIIDNFNNKKALIEEGIDDFQTQDFNKKNKRIVINLNVLYSKLYRNKTKSNKFYQNYSFRASWCVDGFTSCGMNSNGIYYLDINKIIIHGELYTKDELNPNLNSNYEIYLKNLKKFIEKYKIFFKCLFENYEFENLKEYETNWNKNNIFTKRIMEYIFHYSKHLHKQHHNLFKNSFFKDEIFNLSLLDILFGKPSFQIIKIAHLFENNKITDNLFRLFTENFKKNTKNSISEVETKDLLSKWFERKVELVKNLI